ncbi:trafficking protein mon1 domain-containing protein [Hirsutella rhossiliensis]|uniref:Vacuolar fusion protein MON1 n=1 Tax=Hirsutella rhossiliensis TaxID=111463 RepID=A0A9P8MVZ0_9HYPO|nr:trafficking protein mon1 domain-containing protein [Hirsutella rhossiliensis]KAH0963233.1 trafficking protein mon1 domain-containing protein [Hirsutella rhossiliensis]
MGQETGSAGDEHPPPLPPRTTTAASADSRALLAQATTAISPVDIQTLSFPDGSRGTFSVAGPRSVSTPIGSGNGSPSLKASVSGGEGGDDAVSVTSFAPTMRPAGDLASLLAGNFNRKSPAWTLLRSQSASVQPFERDRTGLQDRLAEFPQEFEPLPDEVDEQFDDDDRLAMWKSKLKHYMILSSAGKPVWSRHGDLSLINSSIGVVQTIISFYEGSKSPLQGFTAGDTRFIVSTQGPLYFIAISKLGESDSQLRAQLEALYMQILSTLTLPTLRNIFINRPSTDLRKPLQGTESLLSSLADNFTMGSASALLRSLECLKLPKSERHTINNTFLKLRASKLLYGLIVAGGKLVSVIRPRRHSLHPSDLQLIFNMLFESDGIKGGGGENWIPICLPAFNNQGYLYMYVSFFEGVSGEQARAPAASQGQSAETEIAMVLISADRESFYGLKQMRDDVAQQLAKNGSLASIRKAARAGRPSVSQVAPGSQISHFLYKSRANVQFCMASLQPWFVGVVKRRRLMTLYHELHASAHAKHAHLKVMHCASEEATSLAWVTPVFEFYCVGGPNLSRESMSQGANKIIQWAKKEEQRLFIIGGGVF